MPDVYVRHTYNWAFGIDSINIQKTDVGFILKDLAGTARDIKVMFEDGTSRTVKLDAELVLQL